MAQPKSRAREGRCPLTRTAGRNYSNVHADVARLVEPGLIERTDDDKVTAPFDAVEIRTVLARAA